MSAGQDLPAAAHEQVEFLMARLGMEVKEVSPLEYGVHQPGHEAVSAGMNAQQVEELTVAYIVRWQHRHLTRERSEEHTSELQSLMRISYAVFCLKKKKENKY